jgi:hypothetical protein
VRRIDELEAGENRIPLLLWFRLLAMQRLVHLRRMHLGAQMRDASLKMSLNQRFGHCPDHLELADRREPRKRPRGGRARASDDSAVRPGRTGIVGVPEASPGVAKSVVITRVVCRGSQTSSAAYWPTNES